MKVRPDDLKAGTLLFKRGARGDLMFRTVGRWQADFGPAEAPCAMVPADSGRAIPYRQKDSRGRIRLWEARPESLARWADGVAPRVGERWRHEDGTVRAVTRVSDQPSPSWHDVDWRRDDMKPGPVTGSCSFDSWHRWAANAEQLTPEA